MCGDSIISHGPYTHNHTPMSMWDYNRSLYVDKK
jgi:hypothetical protein